MGITDKWSKLVGDSFLDEPVKSATGNPVGINDLLLSVRGLKSLVYSDKNASSMIFNEYDMVISYVNLPAQKLVKI